MQIGSLHESPRITQSECPKLSPLLTISAGRLEVGLGFIAGL